MKLEITKRDFYIIFIIFLFCVYKLIKEIKYLSRQQMLSKLLKQCARWKKAADQDLTPLIAVLHSNYAAGYLWSIKDIFENEEIEKQLGGREMRHKFENAILETQKDTTRNAVSLCKEFSGDFDFMSVIAGEG